MAKLQKIKRKNGSNVYSVNIPLSIVETFKLEKGQEIEIFKETTSEKNPHNIITLRFLKNGD